MTAPMAMTRPSKKIHTGDNLAFLKGYNGPPIRAIITDPPYNIGVKYASHDDKMPYLDYIDWLRRRISRAAQHLTEDGQIAVFLPWQYTLDFLPLCTGAMGLHWRDQIIWSYTFGQYNKGGLTPAYVPIQILSKHKTNRVWNVDDIRVPSNRQLKYKDKRANPAGKTPDNVWVLDGAELKKQFAGDAFDVWVESRICGTYKERNKLIANQLPISLTDRLVKLMSNPGDVVFDGFAGSCTVGESAVTLGRHFVGCELDPETAEFGRTRVQAARERAFP